MRISAIILASLLIVSCGSSRKETVRAKEEPKQGAAGQTPESAAVAPVDEPATAPMEPGSLPENEVWTPADEANLPDLEKRLEAKVYNLWECNYEALLASLEGETPSVILPGPSGLERYLLQNSNTMNAALAEKFPDIKSYKGTAENGQSTVRVDTNDEGLFIEYDAGGVKYLLAPFLQGSKRFYILYPKDAVTDSSRDGSYK